MPEGERHKVYPGEDPRVIRIVRKVIRGLCRHHRLASAVSDGQVWVDIQRFAVPPPMLEDMTESHAEADVLRYRYRALEDEEIHS